MEVEIEAVTVKVWTFQLDEAGQSFQKHLVDPVELSLKVNVLLASQHSYSSEEMD